MTVSDNSVGKISIDLEINIKKGIDDATKKLKNQCKSVADGISNSFSSVEERVQKILGKTFKEAQKEVNSFDLNVNSIEELEEKCKQLGDKVKEYNEKCTQAAIEEANEGCKGATEKISELLDELKKKYSILTSLKEEVTSNMSSSDQLPAKSPQLDDTPKNNSPPVDTKGIDEAIEKTKKAKQVNNEFEASVKKFTKPYDDVESSIDRINQKLELQFSKLARDQQTVEKIAKQYSKIDNSDLGSEEAQKLEDALYKAESQVLRDKDAIDKLQAQINKTASFAQKAIDAPIKKANSGLSKIRSGLSKVGSVGKSVFSKLRGALKDTDKSTKKTNSLFQKLGKTVRSVFKATFITAALYAAFRGLKALFSDAMAQSSDFQKSLNSLKGNFKIAFQPIISVVLPILTKLMNALSQTMASVASFISGVFGTTYEQSKQSAKEASETAKKSSKEAQNYLNSYDVANVAQDTSKDKSSDEEGIDFDAINTKGNKTAEGLGAKFKKILSELFEPIQKSWKKYGQPVIDAIKNAVNNIKTLFISVGSAFKDVWTDGTGERFVSSILNLVRSIVTTVGKIAGAFDKAWNKGNAGKKTIKTILNYVTSLHNLWVAVSDSIGRAFDSSAGVKFFSNILNIVKNIYTGLGNLVKGFTDAWTTAGLGDAIMLNLLNLFNSITGFVDRITNSFAKWAGELDFTPLLESVNGLLDAFAPLADILGGVLADAFENVLLPLGKWGFEEALPKTLDTVSGAFEMFGNIIDSIKPGVEYFLNKVLKPIGEWTGKLITDALGKLKELFKKVADVFKEKGDKITNIIKGISDAFAWVWDKIKPILDVAKRVVLSVFDSIGDAVGPIIDALSGLVDFIKGVFTGDWEKAWSGIKEFFKGIWDGLVAIVKSPINSIIYAVNWLTGKIADGLNWLIGGLNKISFDIPDWVPFIGGKKFGFDISEIHIPEIPYLATGGIVSAPTLAMVGDNPHASSDPEVVSPLSKLKNVMDDGNSKEIFEMLRAIYDLLLSLKMIFNCQVDGETLFKLIVDLNRKNTINTGVNALI